MRLAASNIGWGEEEDGVVLARLAALGFEGLEIAPTRVFPANPYARLAEAAAWARRIKQEYGLAVCSMQSIWYGRPEGLFGPPEERAALLAYTCRGVDFAAAVGCPNLVLGSPKNRALPEGADRERAIEEVALPFLRAAGDYAAAHGAVIALEPNPPAYGTNFVNTAREAFALAARAGTPGLAVNLDLGALRMNGEEAAFSPEDMKAVHHVHFSAPGLAPPEKCGLYEQAAALLRRAGYGGFVSLEMARPKDGGDALFGALATLAEVFA